MSQARRRARCRRSWRTAPSELALALSHGEQRQLEIAMCLATEPQLLLLDEPLAGMGAEESVKMIELIAQARRESRGFAGRARHGCGLSIGQSADRHGQRQSTCHRHARRDSRQPRSSGCLSRQPSRTCRDDDTPIIEARGLHTYYGASHVLQGVDLTVHAGEAIGLMGRNGMGKTTLHPIVTRPSAAAPRRNKNQRQEHDARRAASDRARRHRLRAGRPRNFSQSHCKRKSHHGGPPRPRWQTRLDLRARAAKFFRGSPSGFPMAASNSPAASSKCCRSAARS